eukprot:6187262-Pleurochrysis_carterae.AAC.2
MQSSKQPTQCLGMHIAQRLFHRVPNGENALVRTAHPSDRETDGRFARSVARERERASIQHVDEARVTQQAQVPLDVLFVALLHLGDQRRDARRRGIEHRVVRREQLGRPADHLLALEGERHVVGS